MRTYIYHGLLGLFMPNRTVSLCDISDKIREKLVKDRFPWSFSHWIRAKLMEEIQESAVDVEPGVTEVKVPWYYECQLCHQKGHHQSNCSLYNPVIEKDGETE